MMPDMFKYVLTMVNILMSMANRFTIGMDIFTALWENNGIENENFSLNINSNNSNERSKGHGRISVVSV